MKRLGKIRLAIPAPVAPVDHFVVPVEVEQAKEKTA